jgi:glycosyltransferase involved in cell wall biosynthesis
MKRLAVIPSEPINEYLSAGFHPDWLRDYFNPLGFFEEVYLLSPKERDNQDLLGMQAVRTEPSELQRRIEELNIDVVRAYGGYWACNMACNNKVSNVPVVVSVHDARISLLYDSIRKADIVWCTSEAVRKIVLKKYRNNDHVWILPNRVNMDLMRYDMCARTDDLDRLYPQKFRIVHVGRRVPEKNLDTLIHALKILGEEYCIIAIGKGDARSYIQQAMQAGVHDRCYFIDALDQSELARYYAWADCMCTPSRSEGFGIVFIEALSCEAVVVTSDIAPMNGYIKNMTNGILVKEYLNPSALAESIRKACNDTHLRALVRNNARSSVQQFDKRRVDEKECAYYAKVLEMKDRRVFYIPYYMQLCGEFEKGVRRVIPASIRKTIRNYKLFQLG